MRNTEVNLKSAVLSLSPLQGELGYENAKHLLNRSMFGPRHAEIKFMQHKTAEEALDFLFQEPLEELPPPLNWKESDDEVPFGTTWVNTKYNSKYRDERIRSYNGWWIGRMLDQNLSLQEKMVLFWHNHLAIENDIVQNTNYNY